MSGKRKIDLLVIHCTDSQHKHHDNIETVRKWHTERGFTGPDGILGSEDDIGYHFLITSEGNTYKGRPESKIGAHAAGFNSNSIGICLTGKTKFTEEQFKSLETLCKKLCAKYNLTKMDIVGHRDLSKSKTCPNFNVQELVSKWGWH